MITRQDIIKFIKANPDRTNPGSGMTFVRNYRPPQYRGTHELPFIAAAGPCDYFVSGKVDVPSCVIGNVLALHGYTDEDTYGNQPANDLAVFDLDDTAELAVSVQTRADRGYTWGTALALALLEEGK